MKRIDRVDGRDAGGGDEVRLAPGALRWNPAARESDHVCADWDFLPTAAAIAGVTRPAGLDGLSMLPALVGERAPSHEFLYGGYRELGSHPTRHASSRTARQASVGSRRATEAASGRNTSQDRRAKRKPDGD